MHGHMNVKHNKQTWRAKKFMLQCSWYKHVCMKYLDLPVISLGTRTATPLLFSFLPLYK